MKKIAEIAQVSTATVSHVINGTRFVSDEIKERVCAAMEDVGYYPNLLARGLRNQATKTIGLIIPDIGNFYYTGVSVGVEGVLKENGYHMILSNSYDKTENDIDIIKLYNSLQVDGVVMVPAAGDHQIMEKFITEQYPIIYADRRPKGITGDFVILENVESTYKAIDLLIKKGHRNICLVVGDPDLSTTSDRIQGYKDALRDNDIEFDESLILFGSFSYESGCTIAEKLIRVENVTAAFFANEMMTVGAMAQLKRLNKRIPDDIAIISCNDFRWTEITDPPLTVVNQPSRQLGKAAAELLIRRIENKEAYQDGFTHISVPTDIIIRKSC